MSVKSQGGQLRVCWSNCLKSLTWQGGQPRDSVRGPRWGAPRSSSPSLPLSPLSSDKSTITCGFLARANRVPHRMDCHRNRKHHMKKKRLVRRLSGSKQPWEKCRARTMRSWNNFKSMPVPDALGPSMILFLFVLIEK